MTDVDDLARIAVELITRVRDDTPDANGTWLAEQLPDPGDWFRLAFVLAAAIPEDRSWKTLTRWAELAPCGTHAAAARHRYHGEDLCALCREAERERDRRRKRQARTTAQPERSAA